MRSIRKLAISAIVVLVQFGPLLERASHADLIADAAHNPAYGYILGETPEGQRILDQYAKASLFSHDKKMRIERALKALEADKGNTATLNNLTRLAETRFTKKVSSPENPHPYSVPLTDLDKAALRGDARQLLYREMDANGRWVSGRSIKPESLYRIAEGDQDWAREFLTLLRKPVVASERGLVPEYTLEMKGAQLLENAQGQFSRAGIPFRLIEDHSGAQAIAIEPGTNHRLSLLAKGLHDNLEGVCLVYSPTTLLKSNVAGMYCSSSKSVLMPHTALLNQKFDQTTAHETLHANFKNMLNHGELTPFHGSISLIEGPGSAFSYAKYMSFEELATHSLNLKILSGHIKDFENYFPEEKRWALKFLMERGKAAELTSAYAKRAMQAALAETMKNHGDLKLLRERFGEVDTLVASIEVLVPEEGIRAKIEIPFMNSEKMRSLQGDALQMRAQARSALVEELQKRLQMYADLNEQHKKMNALLGQPLKSAQDYRRLEEALSAPRKLSLQQMTGKVPPSVQGGVASCPTKGLMRFFSRGGL